MKIISRIPYLYLIAIPLLLILSGAASNQAVLVANWGKFPVMINDRVQKNFHDECVLANSRAARHQDDPFKIDTSKAFSVFDTAVDTTVPQQDCNGQFIDDIHSVMGHNSRLKYLADFINLKSMIASPGDVVLWLGEWLLGFTPVMWFALILRRLMVG